MPDPSLIMNCVALVSCLLVFIIWVREKALSGEWVKLLKPSLVVTMLHNLVFGKICWKTWDWMTDLALTKVLKVREGRLCTFNWQQRPKSCYRHCPILILRENWGIWFWGLSFLIKSKQALPDKVTLWILALEFLSSKGRKIAELQPFPQSFQTLRDLNMNLPYMDSNFSMQIKGCVDSLISFIAHSLGGSLHEVCIDLPI